MKIEFSIRTSPTLLVFLCIMNLSLCLSPMQVLGAAPFPGMGYCSVPPSAGSGVKPNLLLMIDNSASMYDPAYSDPSTFCIDDGYETKNTRGYPGYFEEHITYAYDFTGEKFAPSSVKLPVGCNAVDKFYLCVSMSNDRKVVKFLGSGRFLNWLSMSKLDIEKQVLTGGKFVSSQDGSSGMLLPETRGCQGRRYLKIVSEAPQLTFAVRGPIPSETDYQHSSSQGGETRIEIYDRHYDNDPCLDAAKKSTARAESDTPREQVGLCSENSSQEIATSALSEPSAIALPGGAKLSVPRFVLDAGVSRTGGQSGTLRARVSASAPPAGLIQQFSHQINFGAMVFNDNGSGSECKSEKESLKKAGSGEGEIACVKYCVDGISGLGRECNLDTDCDSRKCREISRLDGGRIIAPVNSALGDHRPSTGLIAAIDELRANSWTPLSESFYTAMGYFANRNDLRLQSGDFKSPSPAVYSCQKNNVLIISDGSSTADRHPKVTGLVAKAVQDWVNETHQMPASMTSAAGDPLPYFQGSYNLDDLAWVARHRNIADFSKPALTKKDFLSTYVIYTGVPCLGKTVGACDTTDEGVPEKMMQLTAAKGGGKIASAQNPSQLRSAFRDMLQQIAAGSGSETSILSTGEGNGALFLQEQFYPEQSFDGGRTSASWIGEMQSLWYHIDPFLGGSAGAGSTIREDTLGDLKLDLKKDRIVALRLDPASNKSYAYLTLDADGDGVGEGAEQRVELDQLKSLWRVGRQLWGRDLASSPRIIYTPLLKGGIESAGSGLMKFSFTAPEAVRPYLNLQAGDPAAAKLIKYLHGFDFPGDETMRSRTVTIAGLSASPDEPQETGKGVWKLGDIISSTPQLQSSVPLGSYHLPLPGGYNDASYRSFIESARYKGRAMVYVGANDGMLHAFNPGKLNARPDREQKAALEGSELGKEQWAFVPKNALPYLKYLADPNYQHLYYVDGKSTLIDASIGDKKSGTCRDESYWNCSKSASSWRTILIGGMGLGGASCDAGGDCVPTPAGDPSDATSTRRFGYSSYFALDVTDPVHPSLLWEFSNPALGYSTTGPAIVRIGDPWVNGSGPNGRWFAVFGSGPTGPIDMDKQQFLGRASYDPAGGKTQELTLFVVDLRTGDLVRAIPTGIHNAFAGSMGGASIDVDRRGGREGSYQDDALYVGYSQLGTGGNWNAGGVLRLLTKEQPDAEKWEVSTVINGIGPVTTGIAKLRDSRKNQHLWLYFGTGRYFFSQDDLLGRRALYGIKEPCYNYRAAGMVARPDRLDPSCRAAVNGELVDQTASPQEKLLQGDPGWRIDLDPATGAAGAERLVSNPSSLSGGAVFFSTFLPSTDPCLSGGSYLWGVKYDTGGAVTAGSLQGKVLAKLSNGSLQETGLAEKLTDKDGRRSKEPVPGKSGGVKIVSNSGLRPLKKIIHLQER